MENNSKKIDNIMSTRWSSGIDRENVLSEYPRPQMKRKEWLNLNGLWDYAVLPRNQNDCRHYEGKILVPFPLESALSGVQRNLHPDEKIVYRRFFQLPGEWIGKRLILHFGAVDWLARVIINGVTLGEHQGGFCPFSFDITDFVNSGSNEITVSAWDPTDRGTQERGKQSLKPGWIFYSAVSGIWQTVWLEPVSRVFIENIRMLPDTDNELLKLEVNIKGRNSNNRIEAAVFEGTEMVTRVNTINNQNITIPIKNQRLWSPDDPFLYKINIRLHEYDTVTDEIDSYFGMRKFSIEKDDKGFKRLFLNNKPLFQNGPLDQGYWPDGLYTAPTDSALCYDLQVAKKMGFNMIRKHVKLEPARWYYHCDRIGLIVWQDMPSGGGNLKKIFQALLPNILPSLTVSDRRYKLFGRSDPGSRNNFLKEVKETVDALYNHPSIGMWVIFNESWGQFDAKQIYKWLATYDSSRYIDSTSGWFDQGAGHIKSIHTYFRKLKWPKNVRERAVIISEYGGYSLQVKGHLWREKNNFGYKTVKTMKELETAYCKLFEKQVKPLIKKGLSGVVYTQLTDVENEVNGLLTSDREITKINPANLFDLHRETKRE